MSDVETLEYTDSRITELEDVISSQKKLLYAYEKELNGARVRYKELKLELKVYKKALKLAVTDIKERYGLLDRVRGE